MTPRCLLFSGFFVSCDCIVPYVVYVVLGLALRPEHTVLTNVPLRVLEKKEKKEKKTTRTVIYFSVKICVVPRRKRTKRCITLGQISGGDFACKFALSLSLFLMYQDPHEKKEKKTHYFPCDDSELNKNRKKGLCIFPLLHINATLVCYHCYS